MQLIIALVIWLLVSMVNGSLTKARPYQKRRAIRRGIKF